MKGTVNFIAFLVAIAIPELSHAACVKGLEGGATLSLRLGPTTQASVVASIPASSCRVVIDEKSCSSGWCRAFYDSKFGWVSKQYIQNERTGQQLDANYYMLRSVYEVVGKRANRTYDLSKSYSQDMIYKPDMKPVKRFYYVNGFKYPGGPGPTQCVAAVSEVLLEAINLLDESAHSSLMKLASSHFSAGARNDELRPHIWEYKEVSSKGAGHALDRFNIGRQIKFSTMTPGDLFKMSRDGGAGHSTVFIHYVDKAGKPLERYSPEVKGVRYFSAQRAGGVDLFGNATNGLGFRTEYFVGNCPSAAVKESLHCHMFPEGSAYEPNMGFLLHPSMWGEIGSNLRKEFANKIYAAKLGVPPGEDYTPMIASGDEASQQDIKKQVDAELSKPIDFQQKLPFDD